MCFVQVTKRFIVDAFQIHPWVTKHGEDPLLPEEENCADLIEPPTEKEKEQAITGNMASLLVVVSPNNYRYFGRPLMSTQMKAVKRFKRLLHRKRPELMEGIFGRSSRIVTPPHQLRPYSSTQDQRSSRSADDHDRKPVERALTTEGVHHDISVSDDMIASPKVTEPEAAANPESVQSEDPAALAQRESTGRMAQESETTHHPQVHRINNHRAQTFPTSDEHSRGHAHDPLMDNLFLDIGIGPVTDAPKEDQGAPLVSESPTAVDGDVYEEAYKQEMERILAERGDSATLYMNRRVEHHDEIRKHENVIGQRKSTDPPLKGVQPGGGMGGLAGLVAKAKANAAKDADEEGADSKEAA